MNFYLVVHITPILPYLHYNNTIVICITVGFVDDRLCSFFNYENKMIRHTLIIHQDTCIKNLICYVERMVSDLPSL